MEIKKLIKTFGLLLFTLPLVVSCGDGGSSSSSDGGGSSGAPQYTISFYANGGSETEEIVAYAGAKITAPDNPIKTGFTFEGWFKDYGTYKNEFVFNVMPAENFCLYANWKKVSSGDIKAYEDSIDAYSQANHLYIHYKRFADTSTDYANWSIWLWQHTPNDLTGRAFNWTQKDGALWHDDYGGAICDIDLSVLYTDAGNKANENTWYMNDTTDKTTYSSTGDLCKQLGFLIVLESSKTSTSGMWTSDGASNTFFNTADGLRSTSAIHLFLVQDNIASFSFTYSSEEFDNPYDDDDGTNVSKEDVDYTKTADIAATSNDFYQNVGVGYQVMVSSFADSDGDGMGDIYGITQHLDYFTDVLHINALWLTPIQLSDSYHGYDIVDYTAVDPKFGSKSSPNCPADGTPTEASALADYQDLLNAADAKGIRVVMDLVINHTSLNNTWFQNSAKLDEDFRSYYQWRNWKTDSTAGDGTSTKQNWYQYSTYDYAYYAKFASSMPELNYGYLSLRDAIVGVAKYWIEKGVDGFRIDAVKHLYMADEANKNASDIIIQDYDTATSTDYSSNLTKNLHAFRYINSKIKEYKSDAFIVGENFDGNAYQVAPYYEGLDSMLNFYNYYNMTSLAVGGQCGDGNRAATYAGVYSGSQYENNYGLKYSSTWDYKGTLSTYNQYRGSGSATKTNYRAIDSIFTSNHDIERLRNRVAVTSLSNGDITTTTSVTSSNAAASLQKAVAVECCEMFMPGITWIYYGDELGMSGNNDDNSSSNKDRWYRQPFKWATAETEETCGFSFSGDRTYKVEWDSFNKTLAGVAEQKTSSTSTLMTVAKATALKSSTPALIYGSYTPLETGNNNVFSFSRTLDGTTYKVYANYGTSSLSISGGTLVFASSASGSASSVPACSVVVVKA